MTRVAITGAGGRMGRVLAAAIHDNDGTTLAAAIERPGTGYIGTDVGELAGIGPMGVIIGDDLAAAGDRFDVLIDFTVADATEANVDVCREHGKKMVIGTTGLSDAQSRKVEAAASEIAIVHASNYSVGVNATFRLADMAARMLGDDVDIEIIEAHHRHKVDAPSGTALSLGKAVAEALGRNLDQVAVHGREGMTGARDRRTIGFHAIRGGEIVGEHTIIFAGDGERLEITHRSQSRMNFAQGAVRAAIWVMDQGPGRYDMQDVLGPIA